ncbi:integral membrane protein [SAR116 cluster alpha proteobacterium HIMB100]|nr:integral membrane protein [SAR116 cluster alpha proteobacterium HIMB100]
MSAPQPPQHRWYHNKTEAGAEAIVITLWPYRSLSLRGFQILIAVLASLMTVIGFGFYLLGAWPVIGFLGLEILVVWYAFKWNYRSGQLVETVAITPQQVDVTRTDWRGRETTVRLSGAWIKAELDVKEKRRERLYLRQHAHKLEIGAFMPPSEKLSLANALNAAFSRLRYEANNA